MIYYYYLSLLFVCAHMCECVHGMEMLVPVCMHAEAREGCQVFSFIILHLFFPPSLNLKFTISTKLAGQQVPNLHVAMLGLQAQCSHI